jgi:hypothetical protein
MTGAVRPQSLAFTSGVSALPTGNFISQPHVWDVLALGKVMPPFSVKVSPLLLHESQNGAMRSPVTSGLIIWAPNVGVAEQSEAEQVLGQDFPE